MLPYPRTELPVRPAAEGEKLLVVGTDGEEFLYEAAYRGSRGHRRLEWTLISFDASPRTPGNR